MKYLTLLLLASASLTEAFFFGGSSGCGCSAPPSCPPPAPAPVCAPPPACPCGVVAHAAKTVQAYGPVVHQPDELEMRAAAFGIPLQADSPNVANIQQLERLGDQYERVQVSTNVDNIPMYEQKIEDADLFASLKRSTEIRRSPTISFSEDVSTTTVATETNKVKDEESKNVNDKCNSEALHTLMLEHISDNSSESKRKINVAAEAKFGGNVDVVCSRGHFSYVFSSNLYCEATKGLTTCIAYRQAA